MACIYAADIFCDDCADDIRTRIATDLWGERHSAECPDGTPVADFPDYVELTEYLEGMDERTYDSGEYPKWCDGESESDCPEHCGSHADCINAGELADGFKYGYCFGNELTGEGIEYVREAVRDGEPGGVARELWAVEFDWIDFDERDDDDDYDDC
jgi:hypothetical protein